MSGPDGDAIALRIVLAMPNGPALTKEWTWDDVLSGRSPQWVHAGPPGWLRDPEMSWNDPMLPVEVRANVPVGYEEIARDLLSPTM